MLNIPSYVEDMNYRYRMPALSTRVEGRGNGIKTNVINLSSVARALRVPTEYPLRFFATELAANIEYKVARDTGEEKSVIKGAFTS